MESHLQPSQSLEAPSVHAEGILTHDARYTFAVRALLAEHAPQRVSMPGAARALSISVRTLRRHLAAEGTSFRELECGALALRAKQLLQDSRCTVQAIARELGFSDAPTFYRAFKRWTGMTPSAFREGSTQAEDTRELSFTPPPSSS